MKLDFSGINSNPYSLQFKIILYENLVNLITSEIINVSDCFQKDELTRFSLNHSQYNSGLLPFLSVKNSILLAKSAPRCQGAQKRNFFSKF